MHLEEIDLRVCPALSHLCFVFVKGADGIDIPPCTGVERIPAGVGWRPGLVQHILDPVWGCHQGD